jgi:HEAT repeat protein
MKKLNHTEVFSSLDYSCVVAHAWKGIMSDDISPLETAINIVKQKSYPPTSRMNALLYMIEKFDESLCTPIFEALLYDTSEDREVRSAAALALGKTGSQQAYLLLTSMYATCDNTLKSYVLQALGFLGNRDSIALLLNALNDPDNDVFASAAEALGKLGQPAILPLIALLAPETPDDSRCAAAWQLGTMKSKEAIPALLESIKNDVNLDVLALAIWALGEIGLSEPLVQDALVKARQHDNALISQRAERALKKISRHLN